MHLSVVVPVYNSAQYLDRCIESIISQSFTKIELILVDDGSTDNSLDICKEWAKKENRIKVIQRENGGLSAARNTGIDNATSEYITFVDSDDALSPNTYAPNMEILKDNPNVDLLEYPIDVHYGAHNAYTILFDIIFVEDDIFRKWVSQKGYQHCYACNKIYKKHLFSSTRFPVNESFEDAAICPTLVKKANCICFTPYGRYLYYANNTGITNQYSFQNQEPLFRHNCTLLSYAIKSNYSESVIHIWTTCLNLLIDLKRCSNTDDRYLAAATSFISANRPKLHYLTKTKLTAKERLKFICATIIGTGLFTNILSKNRGL